jgi:hypothetical protein
MRGQVGCNMLESGTLVARLEMRDDRRIGVVCFVPKKALPRQTAVADPAGRPSPMG